MADAVDPEKLQVSREWRRLQAALAVRTPVKLAEINALSKQIRAASKAKRGKRK